MLKQESRLDFGRNTLGPKRTSDSPAGQGLIAISIDETRVLPR